MNLFDPIQQTIESLDVTSVSEERKAVLQPLSDFIKAKLEKKETIRLNFICTHNSRRSHLSQVWAQAIGAFFGIKDLASYSGGTEATALFPSAAEALESSGFQIQKLSEEKNPVYSIQYAENTQGVIGFSKKFDDTFNPSGGFAAILTCDSANEACPFVPGCEKRIPITFEDPKAFDGTPQQAEKYKERSIQIATELFWVFSQATT